MSATGKRVLVGMSGGVDSSLAASLLCEQGYEVTGGFMKNWSESKDGWTGACAWRGERRDAMRVAAQLGISLLTFDFEEQYRARVLDRMFEGYEKGITPNPDVLCNQEIKFGIFLEVAIERGFDFVATGHYARVIRCGDGVSHLHRGIDRDKDQSYFLHRLSQRALSRTLFPIGVLTKDVVRNESLARGLATATKPDSQGICFVGKLDFHDFLRTRIPPTSGEIVTPTGEVVGVHDGLDAFTVGQRHGLRVDAERSAWYVAAKNRKRNRLIIVPDRDHPLLSQRSWMVQNVNWCGGEPARFQEGLPMDVRVAVRYRQDPVPAVLRKVGPEACEVTCDRPVWAVAAGQSAVFYQESECMGGGFIVEKPYYDGND